MRALALALVCACNVSPMVYTGGVPNLDQLAPNVYRSGQITTADGWSTIRRLAGERTVHVVKLNYDNEGSDELADAIGAEVHAYPIQPQGDQDVWDDLRGLFVQPDVAVLDSIDEAIASYASDPAHLVLVHCTHGQDRTGLVVGRRRVRRDGWTKDRAYAEMLAHHFHAEIHGLHESWERFSR